MLCINVVVRQMGANVSLVIQPLHVECSGVPHMSFDPKTPFLKLDGCDWFVRLSKSLGSELGPYWRWFAFNVY